MSVLSLSVPVLCLSVRSCLSVRVCLSVFLSVCLSVAICGPVFFFFSPNVRASSVFDEPVGGQIQQKLPPGETSNEQMRARVFLCAVVWRACPVYPILTTPTCGRVSSQSALWALRAQSDFTTSNKTYDISHL